MVSGSPVACSPRRDRRVDTAGVVAVTRTAAIPSTATTDTARSAAIRRGRVISSFLSPLLAAPGAGRSGLCSRYVLPRVHALQPVGISAERLRGSTVADLAVHQDDDVVGNLQRTEWTCCSTRTTTAPVRRRSGGPRQQLLHDHRRQPHAHLIDEQHLQVLHECPGDGEHLLLAAGQVARRDGVAAGQGRGISTTSSKPIDDEDDATRRFSRTVSPANNARSSGTRTTPHLLAVVDVRADLLPSTTTCPQLRQQPGQRREQRRLPRPVRAANART